MVKFGKERSCNHFDIFTQTFFKKRIPIVSEKNMSIIAADNLFAVEISKVDSEMVFSIGMQLESNNVKLNVSDLQVYTAKEREFATNRWLQNNTEILLEIWKMSLFPILIFRNVIIYYCKELRRTDEVVLLLNRILKSVQDNSKERPHREYVELPEKFHALAKWIEKWAISDDYEREIFLETRNREELVRFVQSVWRFLPEIDFYLDSESSNDSDIANLLSALAETACEAEIRIR